MNKKIVHWGVLGLVLALVAGGFFAIATWRRGDEAVQTHDEKRVRLHSEKNRIKRIKEKRIAQRPRSEKSARRAARPVMLVESYDAKLSPNERKAAKKLQDALDNEDLKGVLEAGAVAGASAVSELRRDYVDALGWFEDKALVELTSFIADADPEVADAAFSNWQQGLFNIEDGEIKSALMESVMLAVDDRGKLDDLSSELNLMDEDLALSVVVNVVEKGGQNAVDVAKEAYEFITGEEYTSVEAAQKWLDENVDAGEDEGKTNKK